MFQKAKPVWISTATEEEKYNRHLFFRLHADSLRGATLRIAAADFYRLSVNGAFVGFGPARAALGYARVDEYDLSALSDAGQNEILISAAGYFCKSLSTARTPSFLCAELVRDGAVLAATGEDANGFQCFECFEDVTRPQKTERYSVQRHFGEVVDLRADPFTEECRRAVYPTAPVTFLPRRVPFADFSVTDLAQFRARGVFAEGDESLATATNCHASALLKNAYSFPPEKEENYGFFPESEILHRPFRFVECAKQTKTANGGNVPLSLRAGEWATVTLPHIHAGFLRLHLDVSEECDLVLAFSEYCETDTFSFRRVNFQGVLEYFLPKGECRLESFEPYAFMTVAVFVKRGAVTLRSAGCRAYARNTALAQRPAFRDPALAEIYQAALRTFAHNAVDLFTDCPSRERAGWLCDSFFTARAEQFFFGDCPIEDAFLENYVNYQNTDGFPRGVLPMCYPSDPHNDLKFIPQWNMWYVLEVAEHLTQRRPHKDREPFRPSVLGILAFLEQYENEHGLLEDLPSWNFVEWSDANRWTAGVNYPTNFLYAATLDAAADTFHLPHLRPKAERIRKTARSLSFDGEVFLDHALRENGALVNQKRASEAGQYYAILFGGVDLDSAPYGALRSHVADCFQSFDPRDRAFCPINAFIGLYLRIWVLANRKDGALLAKTVSDFCAEMCRKTGTLWEYRDGGGSLDHGFASFLATVLPLADTAK